MANGNVLKVCGKIGAGVAIGAVLYDAHSRGKRKSSSYKKTKDAEAITDAYLYGTKLDSQSRIKSKYKNWVRDIRIDNDMRTASNAVVGYFKGVGEMLTQHVLPLVLSTATLLVKGKASIACAGGLALYGLASLIKTTYGLGEYNNQLKK